jgi:hypothetical protein
METVRLALLSFAIEAVIILIIIIFLKKDYKKKQKDEKENTDRLIVAINDLGKSLGDKIDRKNKNGE